MYYRKIESDPKAKAEHDDNEKAKARARMDRVNAQKRIRAKYAIVREVDRKAIIAAAKG